MEEGLRSLVLRSESVFDDVAERKGWVSGGQVWIHRVFEKVGYHSWIQHPWW